MKIIIVGCGKIGITIAQQLSEEGHDIVVVDTNPLKIEEATTSYDVMGVAGNGADYDILIEAGIDTADLLIAVTGKDEINLLCCVFAKKNENCQSIARVRDPLYSRQRSFFKERLGISMIINPELASALEISRVLRLPSAIKIDTFSKGRLELLNFKVTSDQKLNGMVVSDIRSTLKCNVMVCAIERGEDLIIADGKSILIENDIVYIMASPIDSTSFFKKIGLATQQVKNTLIIGGGTIAFYLAKQLTAMGIQVRIMEKDMERCELLSEEIPEAIVVNADAADSHQLMEEGFEDTEGIVAVTNFNEENIFLAMYAKKHSSAKVISKINRISLDAVVDDMDIGSIIYPKNTTANNIIQYVRAMSNSYACSNVETLYKIIDGRAEALEFSVHDQSTITGIPIKNLKLKPSILICYISRGKKAIIPWGDTMIENGDNVIIVTTQKGINTIDDIILE